MTSSDVTSLLLQVTSTWPMPMSSLPKNQFQTKEKHHSYKWKKPPTKYLVPKESLIGITFSRCRLPPHSYFSCRVWPPSSRAKDVCNYKPYFLSSLAIIMRYKTPDSNYSKKWPFIKHFSPLYDNSQKLFTRRVETSLSSYGIVVVVTFWGLFRVERTSDLCEL